MDTTNYLAMLGSQIVDVNGAVVSDTVLNQYMAGSCLAYSRFRNFERRYGEGALSQDAPIGSNQLFLVGGPFVSGATVVIDAFTEFAETVVIQSIARIPPSANIDLTGSPVLATIQDVTAIPHYAGISPVFNQKMGLTLVAGQSQYVMPGDFMRVNQRSWMEARGFTEPSRSQMYLRTYVESQALQPTGWGISQPFLGSGWGMPGAFLGIPALGNNNFNLIGTQGTTFRWVGTSPVILNIWPAPTAGVTLFFTYRAVQQPQTIPDWDLDALLAYGRYLALTANANYLSTAPDLRDIRQDVTLSRAASNLRELAAAALKEFNSKVAMRPVMMTG